jgi:hypothetical protein
MENAAEKFAEKLKDLLNDPEIAKRMLLQGDAALIEGEPNVIGIQDIDGVEFFLEVSDA